MRSTIIAALALGLSLANSNVDGSQQQAEPKKPPSITYGPSRTSSNWVDTGKGRVAVDDGIEWNGVRVYLSLTWDLVAVDARSGKTLWTQNVSAFWNGLAIKQTDSEAGKKTWVVELRTTSRDAGGNLTESYDLQTGKKLPGAVEKGLGMPLKPRAVFGGDKSSIAKGFTLFATTPANWEKVRGQLFAGIDSAKAPAAKDVDFTKEVVLVVSSGNSTNCSGIGAAEAFEDDKRILLRLQYHTFQTAGPDGGAQATRPYGIFILPRSEKAYVIERNRQRYIGGPPLWSETFRIEKLGDPAKELADLPN